MKSIRFNIGSYAKEEETEINLYDFLANIPDDFISPGKSFTLRYRCV